MKQKPANQAAVSESGNTAVNSSAKLPPLPTYQSVGGAALQKTPPLDVKQKKRKSKSNKASSVRRRASKAPRQTDLAAQVAELQGQLAALRAAVEDRETSVESQERVQRPRSRASANPQPTPASSPVESSGYSTGPSHSPLHHAVAAQREGGPPPVTAAEQHPSTRAGAKPMPIYELKETRPVGYQSSDLLDSSSEESEDGFFTGLLDRARMQWLMGDWESLSKLDLEQIQHHPDRAKLAALTAIGQLQTGQFTKVNTYIRLAYEWGGNKKIISKLLLAGAFISIGRASVIKNQIHSALQYFENAVSIVSKAADAKLLIKANIPDISLQMDKEQAHDYWRTSKQSPVNYLIADDKRSKELVRLLQKYIGTGRILEIGCNAGRNLKHLYQAGFTDLEGIEISPIAVKTLRENYPELSGIHIHTGAVEDCIKSIPDYSFECVFTMAVFEHIHYKSDWIFSKISRLARFVVTIEDEISFGKRHFPRSYDKVFEKLGMRQVHFEKCSQWGLPNGFAARVFQNNKLIK